jgi:DNA-directed RNA polymerase specialized sigma24 family protein
MKDVDSPPAPEAFLTTQWTQVLAARGDSTLAGAALRDLCAVYYAPVVAFLQRSATDAGAARDQAHAFFEWVLSRDALAGVDPGRGRFRSYLLGALKHFLAHARERERRLKRGGGREPVPLVADVTETSPGLDVMDGRMLPPDREFDRQWALHVLRRALESLERQCAADGAAEEYAALKPFLSGEAVHGGLAALAAARGLNETTLRARLHRLRGKFRHCVKREVAPTLAAAGEVEDEMTALLAALTG